MDATELLTHQHDEVDSLFEDFQATKDAGERERIAGEATRALRAHTTIEEEIFYPALRDAEDELDDEVLESLEEHHAVEVLLDELEGMSSSDEHYAAKFTVISEMVRHHVEEEEEEMFPEVRDALGADTLDELGERMQARFEELMGEDDALELTKDDLYERAKEMDVQGRSQMSKRQLAAAVRAAE